MNKNEKRFALWVVYLLFVVLVATFSIWRGNPDLSSVAGIAVGLLGLGWMAAKLDVEHLKTKTDVPVVEAKKPTPDDEKYWRELLRKKEPWEP